MNQNPTNLFVGVCQSDARNFLLYVPASTAAVLGNRNILSLAALIEAAESEGAVYILDPASNARLTASAPSEPQPLRQPVSGEIAIRTPEELAKIGVDSNYPLSGKYILMANLDLSSYSSGEGWVPIGNSSTPFTGTFDGNGLVIKNLTINRPSTDYQGLFGYISGAKLTNISLENVNVTGRNNTGGLVGANFGTITSSYSTGSVTGSGYHTGGLVGWNNSTITSSYWDVQTSGIATSAGGTGKTTAEMKQQSTFAGWDFNTIWAIDEGVSYPYLRSNEQIPHPGTVQ